MKNAAKPCFTLEEIFVLLCECNGEELFILRAVVVDEYYLGRYNREEFSHIWTLIDRKLRTGKLTTN